MDILSRLIPPGIIFLLTLSFGVWLSKSGKPYNGILFNVHKLIALGVAITVTIQLYKIFRVTELQTSIIILIIVAGLCAVALFASGAFMSIGNLNHQVLLTIHRIAPALAFIAMALMIYLLNDVYSLLPN